MKQQKNTDGPISRTKRIAECVENSAVAQERVDRAQQTFEQAAAAVRRREPGAVRICGQAIKKLSAAREQLQAAARSKGTA